MDLPNSIDSDLSDITRDDKWPHIEEEEISEKVQVKRPQAVKVQTNQTSSHKNGGGLGIGGSGPPSPSPLHSLHSIPVILE